MAGRQDIRPYIQIGAGTCGIIYEQAGSPLCVKKEKSHHYDQRNLKNDFEMHKIIHKAIAKYGVDIHVPTPSHFVEVDDEVFWAENQSLLPASDQMPSSLLFSERISSLPKEVREGLIERFCPDRLKDRVRGDKSNRNCLVRLYLGQVQRPRARPSMFFNLAHFTLHIDQCQDLGLSIEPFITTMARSLAVMHFEAHLDARDVEFVLGAQPTSREGHTSTESINFMSGKVNFWLLDFNQVTEITMDESGMARAVDAFTQNDPYFPRPGRGSPAAWELFEKEYIHQSRQILKQKDWNIADTFLEGVEKMQQQAEEKAHAATIRDQSRLRDQEG